MKTFLEVENKMGMTIQTSMPNSQFRPPLQATNPNAHKSNNVERIKTIMLKRKFRPATPKVTTTNPPISQATPEPNYEVPSTLVRADTPWPGAGKISGNPANDRQWLLLKGYPVILNNKNDIDTPSLKEELKAGKPQIADSPKEEKCRSGPDCPFCKAQEKKEEDPQNRPLPALQTQKLTKTKSQLLWEVEMERLNDKYNLDCFSDSELDSKSNEGEEYCYKHGYETFI